MQTFPNRKGFRLTKDDFRFEQFSGTGAGGQHRNKHQNCFRCFHDASGASGTGQSERDAPTNKRAALERCVNSPVFKAWAHQKMEQIASGTSVEAWVEEQMRPENIVVETKNPRGQWVEGGNAERSNKRTAE